MKLRFYASPAIYQIVGVMLLATTIQTQDNFYFSINPKDTNVVSGHSITLECNTSNTRMIKFSWTLNDETFPNTTRRFQNGSNLHITRADREKDFGEFKCIATNVSTGFSLSSSAATLNVLWIDSNAAVQLHSPDSSDVLKEGDKVILRCKVEGSPDLEIEWYRNTIRLFRNNRISFHNKKLHLNGVSAWDNGVYSCRAVNAAGAVDSTENFALTLPHPSAAHIVHLPQDLTVKKNDPAWFDCVYKDAAITEWYIRDEGPLTNSSRMTVYSNGTLHLHRVRGAEEGIYKCVGIRGVSDDEPTQTYTAELRIALLGDLDANSLEPLQPTSEFTIIPENKEFEVTCKRPNGHPAPHVWWEDPNGKVISDTGRIRVDDTRLIITSAKKNDGGNYTCIAENMAGIKKISIPIYISAPPAIVKNPISIGLEEGDRGHLNCEYTGNPYPVTKVKWLRDGHYIPEDGMHYILHKHNGSLHIPSVQLRDNGSYICEVNTTGFPSIRSKEAVLIVKEKLKFYPEPVNKNLELNMPSKVYCKARGSTKPFVRWIKGDPLYKWPDHIRDENGTLYFDTVKAGDAGNYTCIATNNQGFINVTIQLNVVVTPKFLVKPANTEALEGYPIMLHCKAYGDPLPTIQWDKNTVVNGFDQKRFVVMENGTLLVKEVYMDDQGRYGCTVGNSGGLKREEVSLIVRNAENYIPNSDSSDKTEEQQDENVTVQTWVITLGAAAAYLFLVIGLIMWCRHRRAKRKALYLQQSSAEVNKAENADVANEAEMKERGVTIREYKDNIKSDGDGQSHSSTYSHQSKKSRASCDVMQFPRQDLQTVMLLGKGEFGDVFLAKAHGIHNGESETVVMVKALQSQEDNAHFNFKREMEIYNKLNHNHIARLLGVCREIDPHFLIMEYSDWGDLKQFLLATRKENPRKSPRPPPLTAAQIIAMCGQIAQGMEYLSNHRYIHRDLAARNCLVTSKLDVKISNPCLSRDTYASEYCRYHNKMIPLRWMPSEAIFEDEYSTKSDIWSYAVLVWELFSQAEFPHSNKSDEMFLKMISGKEIKWQLSELCPKAMCDVLTKCWSDSPKDRPSFSELVVEIGNLNIDSNV